jgi:endoglucanase
MPRRRLLKVAVLVALAVAAIVAGVSSTHASNRHADPLLGTRFFVDNDSDAYWAVQNLRDAGRKADANAVAKIADHSWASWFGDWSNGHGSLAADVRARVDEIAAAGALPVLVVYDIPHRDCGSYSAGGASTPARDRHWIDLFAGALGSHHAVVVLEPDALAELDCLRPAERRSTTALLHYAVDRLSALAGVSVYLDAGNESWQAPAVMAKRLRDAGVAQARGFALNVSNFYSTRSEERYGNRISQLLGGKHYVIDTSRNGRGPGPKNAWCNPAGRGLGTPPTAHTDDPFVDAYLWIKAPGESDGSCRGAPAAGVWWLPGAIALGRHAAF